MERVEKGFILILLIVFAIALFKSLQKDRPKALKAEINSSKKSQKSKDLYSYIVDVINNGSSGHNFKGGVMEGGYISREDAKVVACYVLELSGRRCPHPYPKDKAAGYFSSVCAGCHGNDGKGINGTYPDLTKNEYVGFK